MKNKLFNYSTIQPFNKVKERSAFTLAETIITLVIIGIIASIGIRSMVRKLDNTIGLYYYAAYQTLSEAAQAVIGEQSTAGANYSALPTDGTDRCNKFGQWLNVSTVTGSLNCTSSATGFNTSSTNFAAATPDMILRSGAKIYNLRSGSSAIAEINDTAYTIFIDVDGTNGNSKMWEDIFPFYLTTSGRVVPLINSSAAAGPLNAGGADTKYLEMNIQYMGADYQGHWALQGVDFRTAACRSGYLFPNSNTAPSYCSPVGAGNTRLAICQTNPCEIIPVKPVKF